MVFLTDSSGRSFTDYTPTCVAEDQIKKQAGITDNYSYRLYLQRNADKLMLDNANNSQKITTDCEKCEKCLLISKSDQWSQFISTLYK